MRCLFTGHQIQNILNEYPDNEFEEDSDGVWHHEVWPRHTTDGRLEIDVPNKAPDDPQY